MSSRRERLIHLDLQLVRAFVSVAETGSVSAAAQRLGRTQPAVSMQLKRLEDRLGVALFLRGARKLRLTTEGEIALFAARRLLQANDDLVTKLIADDLAGEVRLGAPEEFAAIHLTPVLAEFARTHPRVAVSVTCEMSVHLLEGLRDGRLDLAVIKRDPIGPDAAAWREPLVWVGQDAEALAPGGPIPLCLRPSPCLLRRRALSALEAVGRRHRVVYTSPSLVGLHAAVRAGLGFTVLPLETVPPDLAPAKAPGLPPLAEIECVLLKSPTGLSHPAEVLAEAVRAALKHQAAARARAA